MDETEEAVPTWTGTQVPPDKMADAVAELVDKSSAKRTNGHVENSRTNGAHPELQDSLAMPPPVAEPAPYRSPQRGRRVLLVAAIFCLTAVAAFIAAALVFARSDAGSSTDLDTSNSTPTSVVSRSESPSEDRSDGNDGNDEAIDVPSESSNEADASPGEIESLDVEHKAVAAASGETSWAVFDQSTLYLKGSVPSQEFADTIQDRVSSVMPADSIVADFLIDPSVDPPVDPPLFVKERVLFDEGTADVTPASFVMIGIAELLMKRYTVTDIAVLSYAPTADGELDQELAAAQSQAVIDIWVDQGIDPARLSKEFIDDPRDDANQQWVEFVVTGLLE